MSTFAPPGRVRGDQVYLYVFDWPAGGQIRIPDLGGAAGAYVLGDGAGEALPVELEGQTLVIAGPTEAPDAIDTVVVLAHERKKS